MFDELKQNVYKYMYIGVYIFLCLKDKYCERLWCKEIGGGRCLSQGQIISDGTSCGQNKVINKLIC